MLSQFRDEFDDMFNSMATFDTHVRVVGERTGTEKTEHSEASFECVMMQMMTRAFVYDILLTKTDQNVNSALMTLTPIRTFLLDIRARRLDERDDTESTVIWSGDWTKLGMEKAFRNVLANELLSLWSPFPYIDIKIEVVSPEASKVLH